MMKLQVQKRKLQRVIAYLLMPLILTFNWPIATLAAPQPPAPPIVPTFAQSPRSIRTGSLKLKPIVQKSLSNHPTDTDLSSARIFEEPLIPMTGPGVSGENDALAVALKEFKEKKNREDISSLISFAKKFPKSRWIPSLQLNLGLLRFECGYINQALILWTSAWNASKKETELAQRAIASRCIAEVLQLNAKVGRMKDIENILAEIEGRPFQGSMEQKVKATREALTQMRAHPEKSFKCGPYAILSLLTIKNRKFQFNKVIDDFPSTYEGTSLQENKALAEKVGLNLQIARRSPGAKTIVPSIMHWTLGHYCAVVAKHGDRYEIKDPTFGVDSSMSVSQAVFDTETDGYALVPVGELPPGWHAVSQTEASKIFGKGVPWIWPDNKGGSRTCCRRHEEPCKTPYGGTGGSGLGGGGGSGGGAGGAEGIMSLDINTTTCNPHLFAKPSSYSCPIGGTVGFGVNYNYLTADQPATFSFTNLGPNWSFEYLSYLTLDVSSTATVRLPQGYSEVYALSGGVYTRDKLSLALLVDMGGGVYERRLPDGTVMVYDLSDGATPAKLFMTKVVDPQGNQSLVQFDSDFRITSVTDPIGQVSTITYISNSIGNSGFYKVGQISDPFSRTSSFVYDSTNTNLITCTDVNGLQSRMFYDSNTFVTSIQTPYGTTSLSQYTPSQSAYPTRGVNIHYPDGSTTIIETWFGHEPYNATFIWDREATEMYPNDAANHDFSHAYKIAWLWGPTDGYLWPIVDYEKAPLENRVEFKYPDEGLGTAGRGTVGTNTINRPIKINRNCGTPIKALIGGSKTTGDVLTLSFTDSLLPGGFENVSYTVLSSDTLTTITSSLAAAVNANSNLQKLGVTAAATGTNIIMVSQSSNLTVYSKSLSGGATETIALATSFPQTAQYTVTGTATSGHYVGFGIYVNNVWQGNIQYNVQPGDTLTTVASGVKNLINGSSLFINRGVIATSFGPTVYLSTSTSPDSISYGTILSGAPTMPQDYQISSGAITKFNQYNSLGNRTLSVDPIGRVFSYTYAGNGIDLTQITEIQNNDSFMLGNWTYNGTHRPTQYIDGSAQTWNYSYNLAGQLTSMTDPNSNTINLTYSGTSNSFLTQINGPLAGNQDITTFSYDGFNRPDTMTDSEGYQLSYDYDNDDRLVQVTYPDGTTLQTIYEKLDAIFMKDRNGLWSQAVYDSMDQLSFEIDALGRKTEYVWCHCGSLSKLTDPSGKITLWHHDLQGRKIEKIYADQSCVKYVYEPGAGRLLSRTDALQQVTNYFLNPDAMIAGTGYQDTVNPTSSVINVSDSKFSRLSHIQNDWGTFSYSYNAYVTSPGSTPTTGGGRLSTIQNNVISNSDISFTYDALGRTTNRSIDGANNSVIWAYDAMSRVTSEQNALGTFNYTYVDDTPGSSKGVTRLASVAYPNSQVTNYDWYGNTNDQRLKTINNLNPSGGTLSRFDYQYNPAGEILQWQQQQNGGNDFHNFKYDLAGQLVSDQVGSGAPHAPFSKEYHYAYDKAANRVGVQSHSVDTLRVSGTVTPSDTLTVTVKDTALTGGQEVVNYVVQGGDTLSTIARGIATAINTNTDLQAIGVAANAQSSKTFVNIRAASGNITTYSASTSGGATEVLSLGIWRNGLENAVIGGTKTTGDIITLTFKDIALSGGTRNVAYTVQAGDTLTSIATNIAAAINADTPLQNLGVSATSVGTVLSIVSNSVNVTSYTSSLSGGATETVALSINQNSLQTATIAGSKTTGDTLTVTVYDSALGGGLQGVTYTVQSGDNLAAIATGVAGVINGNGNLQAIGVSATVSGTVVTIQSKSVNQTSYRATTSSSATETITLSVPVEAWTVAAIAGSKTTNDVLTITVYDAALAAGKKAIGYTVQGGDNLTSIATNLAAAITADSDMQAIGVSATSNSTVVSMKSTSPNLTTFAQSLSAAATETITLSASTSVVQSVCNNVNELIAIAPGGKTRFQGTTSKPVVSAKAAGQVVSVSQTPLKGVSLDTAVSGTPTETLTLGTNVNGNITATVGGTATVGDVLSITVNDIRFRYGPMTISYTVKTGDTTSTIASGLSTAISNALGYGAGGVPYSYLYLPSVVGSVVTINPEMYYADVTYSKLVKGVPTETLTSSANINGNSTVTVGGSVTTGDVASLTVKNVNLPGGEETVTYTAAGGNTLTDVATGLKNAVNASSTLAGIGVTATSSTTVVTITTAGTTYSTSTSGGATETLTLGTNANGNVKLVIGGKATNGDTVTVVSYNPLLPGGQESVGYTVGASDTLVDVAAGLAANMASNTDLQDLGVSAKNSQDADLAFSQSFSGNGNVPASASLANVSATDAVPTTKTNTNSLNVTSSASSALTWDANGNMTSDGTNTYKWDAENRLVEIVYPGIGNNTKFSYDGLWRNVLILEFVAGSVATTRNFIWNGSRREEERDGSSGVTSRFYKRGQTVAANQYFLTHDHMCSVRDATDSGGTIQSIHKYDPFGRSSVSGNFVSDFQFANYFKHSRSNLCLTLFRAYSPEQGRWISRDPVGEISSNNLFAYVENNPVNSFDPAGTSSFSEVWAAFACLFMCLMCLASGGNRNSSSAACKACNDCAPKGSCDSVPPSSPMGGGASAGGGSGGSSGGSLESGAPWPLWNVRRYSLAVLLKKARDRYHNIPRYIEDLVVYDEENLWKVNGAYREYHDRGEYITVDSLGNKKVVTGTFQIGVENGTITHSVFIPD